MALYNKCIDNNQVCLKVVISKGHYTQPMWEDTQDIFYILCMGARELYVYNNYTIHEIEFHGILHVGVCQYSIQT